MSSTSKLIQRNNKKSSRNWLDLPSDITVNILERVGVNDILENAQKVCTAWREICKDPSMWRVIYVNLRLNSRETPKWLEMYKDAVDRSQGQLVDFTMFVHACDHELLQYVADRSSQLRRLEIVSSCHQLYEGWSEAIKKFSLLEELSVENTNISREDIEIVGCYCPLLKTLSVKHDTFCSWYNTDDEFALAIGKNLPDLTHLELTGICMKDIWLQAILDGCCRLESLDLSWCVYANVKGDLKKRCSQQIKYVKLPEKEPHPYDLPDNIADYVYFDYEADCYVYDDSYTFDFDDDSENPGDI